jgi:hypothetical protein
MIRQPKYSKEEHARMGKRLYEERVRAQVEAGNHGRLVAIDVDSGDYELGDSMLEASNRLIERYPDAQIWFVRIGHRAVHRFGGRSKPGSK